VGGRNPHHIYTGWPYLSECTSSFARLDRLTSAGTASCLHPACYSRNRFPKGTSAFQRLVTLRNIRIHTTIPIHRGSNGGGGSGAKSREDAVDSLPTGNCRRVKVGLTTMICISRTNSSYLLLCTKLRSVTISFSVTARTGQLATLC